jgi:hypothetical protein
MLRENQSFKSVAVECSADPGAGHYVSAGYLRNFQIVSDFNSFYLGCHFDTPVAYRL